MKCIRCSHDSKYKERTNQTCPKCKKRFAFEPKNGAKMTDMAFQNAIDRVSGHGKVRWTRAHLYYELCRRLRPYAPRITNIPSRRALIVAAIIVIGVLVVVPASRGLVAFLAALICLAALAIALMWLNRWQQKTPKLDVATFEGMWQAWLSAHGKPAGLIERVAQTAPRRPRRQLESDLGDYSFDRAVICDTPEKVDLLLANNFHFENNCAVLSVDGYPPAPFETVRTMLKRNPRLQVFALHDATVPGCQMANHLAHDPDWFAGQVPVIDVGLRPGHAGRFRGLWLSTPQAAVVPGAGIKPAEAEWLREYSLELAAVRPDQVLKRLFRAMNRPRDDDGDGGGGADVLYIVGDGDGDGSDGGHPGHDIQNDNDNNSFVIEDADSFGSDASADDGGADSFG